MNQPLWIVFGARGYIGSEFVELVKRLDGCSAILSAPPKAIMNHLWFTEQLEHNPKWKNASELRLVILAGAGVIGELDGQGFEFNASALPAAALHMASFPKTKVFVAGSSFEYGLAGNNSEFLDPFEGPLEPVEPYGLSKKSGFDAISKQIQQRENLFYGRIFQVWGGNEPTSRLIPSVLSNSSAGEITELTSGLAVRDFIPVTQVCAQIYDTFSAQQPISRVFNICQGQAQTVEGFCRIILNRNGLDGNLVRSKEHIAHPYRRLVGLPRKIGQD